MQWCLKSPAPRLFTQPLIQAQIKENSASLAFVGEFTGDRWIPRTNGQKRVKCFDLMTSSWIAFRITWSSLALAHGTSETMLSIWVNTIKLDTYFMGYTLKWNVIFTELSSLGATEDVKMTTSGIASDEHYVKMTQFLFQCTVYCPST